MMNRLLRAAASLKLTVALLALSMFLIFAGTLAQATLGIGQTIDAYFRSAIALVDLQLFVPRQIATVPWKLPFPGGGLLCGLLMVNLIAAHAIRFSITPKRLGIVLLHAGLILLFAGEFVTGWSSREGSMAIDEGSQSNFVEDAREVELAFIDITDTTKQHVVAIAQRRLEKSAGGDWIHHEAMPVEIRVEEWMANSQLARSAAPSRATTGAGTEILATSVPQVSGVESDRVDAPSAYVSVRKDGASLGTYLVSLNLVHPERIELAGRTFEFALRFKRTYKPYTLRLLDFRHDKFVGTEIARNFSSRVRLTDPSRNTDREALISMNNPLRYAGETFYQASFKTDNSGTVLLVVRNPGWLIPYIACALVGLGMTYHFGWTLVNFLRRHAKGQRTAADSQIIASPLPARLALWAGIAVAIVMVLLPLFSRAPSSGYDIDAFGRLPVSAGGRVKPFDTVARNALMVAGGKQSVRSAGATILPTAFLLDLMARPDVAKEYPVVRVDHPDVLALLDRTAEQAGRLSLSQIEAHWDKVLEQVNRAMQVPSRQRDPFQWSVLELFEKVTQLLDLSQMRAPYSIPPMHANDEWLPFSDAFLAARSKAHAEDANPAVGHVVATMTAYHEQKPEQFNQAVRAYQALVDRAIPHDVAKAGIEIWFNRIAPFNGAIAVYVLAFLAACGSLLASAASKPNSAQMLRRGSLGLLIGALIVHTLAIGLRIYLQGRPPVTNLYSSAVFIGWACVLMAIVAERLFPLGIAALCASVIGAATLIVAHNLGNDGDTMQMMQAVLDSNFWLATHVITVTLGYATTFLAGFLAILYAFFGLFTTFLTRERSQTLIRMIYGIVCFSLLFSFVGTVLGGIWADQSWGRFWGWDPKENGAALVVLINAIILHARWGGIVRDRGIVFLAVAGNVVTAWSWFGTNMLGIGLHSYGFMHSAVFWLIAFVVSQFLVMSLTLLPQRAWRSGNVA